MKAFSRFRRIHWRPPHVEELKPSEFMVLHTVKNNFFENGNGLRISEISNRLNVAVPTITQLVKSLQRKGYVVKEPDDEDGRVKRVSLSDKGKAMARKGYEEFYERFMGLSEYLGREKSEQLTSLMNDTFEYFSGIQEER